MKDLVFSKGYEERLHAAFFDPIVDQIVCEPRSIDLPEQPGETIPYVRVNEGASTPVFFVPGFGEGIINKAPFAAALASRGFDVILPGQNRVGIVKDAANKRKPTMSQARNNEAILRAEELDGVTVNFVSHSYGSLVLEALVKRMTSGSPDCFKDSQAIMLAPAGVGQESSIFGLGKRWLQMMKSEMDKNNKIFLISKAKQVKRVLKP